MDNPSGSNASLLGISGGGVGVGGNSTTTASATTNMDAKIEADLATVEEKMYLCTTLLHPSNGAPRPSIHHDATIRDIIGFLEACAPRLVELLSSEDAQLSLGEVVLVRCFDVQERLTKLLEEIETLALTETPASTTSAAPAPSPQEQPTEPEFFLNLDDNEIHNNTPVGATKPLGQGPPPANSKGEEDPFGNPVVGAPTPAGAKWGEEDAFDDFFANRQQDGSK